MFEQVKWVLDNMLGLNGNIFTIRENVSPENSLGLLNDKG